MRSSDKIEEFNLKKLLDGAPNPGRGEDTDYIYCPEKYFIPDAKVGEPYEGYCKFKAPKNLSGYEQYKIHWHKEHAQEKVLKVTKIKSRIGEGYLVQVDLVTKGGELIERLIHLELHNFSRDFTQPWDINIYELGNVNLHARNTSLPTELIRQRFKMMDEIDSAKIEDKKEYDCKYTDKISEAEEWQKEGFKVTHISNGLVWLRRKVEDGLFIEKFKNDKEFREKVLSEGGSKESDPHN